MNRKIRSLLVFFLSTWFAFNLSGADLEDITFDTSGDTAVVVDCLTTASGFLEIPATYQGKDVTSIGLGAFQGCHSLTSVTIPDSVTSIGSFAFAFLSNLEAVIFKGNAPTLEEGSLGGGYGVDALVYVSSSATGFVGDNFYFWYGGLRLSQGGLDDLSYKVEGLEIHITDCNPGASGTMTIPETIEGKPVTRLLFNSFSQCSNLRKVHIPDSVTTIEESTFDRCTSLTEVTIGKGLTSLGAWALNSGCDRLKNIIVHPDNPHFSSLHGVLYNKTKTTLRVVPEATTGLLVVPESVTLIGLGALEGCYDIAEIFFKPIQAPAIEEEDGDPFWALEGKTAYVRTNSNGYVNHVDFMYESLKIVTWNETEITDTIPPTIRLFGTWPSPEALSHEAGTIYIDAGAEAVDMLDGPVEVTTSGEVDHTKLGTYILSYTAKDSAGNVATITRSVEVVDTTPPVIDVIGLSSVEVELGQNYTDPGFSAIDSFDNVLSLTTNLNTDPFGVTVTDKVYKWINISGTYKFTYTAVDQSGNTATAYRVVEVTPDVTPPEITLIGEAWNDIYVVDEYTPDDPTTIDGFYEQLKAWAPGATAEDAAYGPIAVEILEDRDIQISINSERTFKVWHRDITSAGLYAVVYRATDSSGNSSVAYRKIQVVEEGDDFYTEEELLKADFKPPVITLNGPERVYVNVGDPYEEQGATAEDAEDGAVEVTITTNSGRGINTNNLGYYEVAYTAKDRFGNRSSATRYVSVIRPNSRLLTFKTNNDSVSVIDCDESISGDLIIPSSWEGKPVTSIDESAFEDCKELAKLTIPISVSSIGDKAFFNCTNLTHLTVPDYANWNEISITIPGGVTYLGVSAFSHCASITSVRIMGTSIGSAAFESCGALEYVSIGDDVESIGDKAFTKCKSLAIVRFTNYSKLKSIGESAFSECEKLSMVTSAVSPDYDNPTMILPNSLKSIGKSAFSDCENLNNLSIGNRVETIGDRAFSECIKLASITIPDSVNSIGKSAFSSCENLKTLILGSNLKSIGDRAFSSCVKLARVIIPDSVLSIGEHAFEYNRGLKSLKLGESVASIGAHAFKGCRNIHTVSIPDSVTHVGASAFYDCFFLKSLRIGKGVQRIGDNAFAGCYYAATRVTLPISLNYVGDNVFDRIFSLKTISFEGNAPELSVNWDNSPIRLADKGVVAYVKTDASGFDSNFGGLKVVRSGVMKGNTSDGPIMDAVVFFDANLNGLPDEGEPQTTSNGWGDYWLDIPLETYDLNGNGVIDINEGMIVSQGGTDTATGLPMKTVLKGPASATVITPLTTLVTRVMEQNPELDASAAADKLEASLGIPDGVDILSFDTFKEASEENPAAADVLTAAAKLQDTLVQGGNLIGGATGKTLQEGSDAVMDSLARQVEAGDAVDLDSKDSLKGLITEAASTSGANLTDAQTDGAASIMEASSKAKEDAKAAASTVTELATEVSRVQAVSQSKAADDLEAVGAQTTNIESTVLAYTGAAMQQQVQTEVVGDFNASSYEAPVFNFQSASYTVNENGQQQPVIQINRTGDSFEAVELTVTPIASSATAGEDFNGEPVSVNFEPLEIRKTLDLQTLLIDDELVEEPEIFSLQLEVVRDSEDPSLPELPEGEEDLLPDRPTVGTIGLATLTIISDPTRTLTAEAATNGSITYTATHELNTTTTVTAVPAIGYLFTAWTGASTGTDNPLTLTMDGDKTIGVTFTKDTADTDGDGFSNHDELVTHKTDPDDSDSDGDGWNDSDEIRLGFSPVSAASTPRFAITLSVSPRFEGVEQITFSFPTKSGKSYRIEESTDLRTWSTRESGIIGNGDTIQRNFPDEGGKMLLFLRVGVD